jgi:hypothetical protein
MKKILNLISKAAVVILMLSLSSCYYDEVIEEVIPDDSVDEVISFAADIQPIFTASCASCHPSFAEPDLTAGNSYSAITDGIYIVPEDLDASLLYQTLLWEVSPMPISEQLPASETNLVKLWIEQGALDN